jgi:hypothetical protein
LKSKIRISAGLLAVVVVGLIGPAAAGAAVTRGPALTPSGDSFDFGSVAVGQTASQVFTLSATRWDRWDGRLKVSLAGSAAFTVASDGCSGKFLTFRNPSCQVTVNYAPTTAGNADTATLQVAGVRWFWWHRWHWHHPRATGVALTGTGSNNGGGGGGGNTGPANLQLSPGTLTSSSGGTNSYTYDFGQVKSAITSFTVKNVGGTTSLGLVLNGWTGDGGYALTSDTCTGHTLAPNATCTFSEAWNAGTEPMCDSIGTPVGLEPSIDSADDSITYIGVDLSAKCGR